MSHGLSPADDGGYAHVLRVALPMVLSHASATIMHTVDRMFLGHYSPDAMAASMTGGITAFTMMSLFLGVVIYTRTFVAQYYGARESHRIAPAIAQGIVCALLFGGVLAGIGAFADPIMSRTGHPAAIMALEISYFRILMFGACMPLLSASLSTLYGGLGLTTIIMLVEMGGNAVNFFLDYALIFGHWGAPEMGIQGAAIATVTAGGVICLTYVALMLFGPLGRSYHVLRTFKIEPGLFWRLLKFGFPNGLQWTIDMIGWTSFIWLFGRIGASEMTAMSAGFAINHFAFLPMIGFSIATSIIVGQFIGAARSDLAERSIHSAFTLTFGWMFLMAVLFVVFPRPLVMLFAPKDPVEHAAFIASVVPIASVMLRFIAFYSLFDSVNLVYTSALKGAGDTRFVMLITLALSVFALIVPVYIVVEVLDLGPNWAMAVATFYIIVMAAAYYLRFRAGHWKSMRVIETPIPQPSTLSDGPIIEP